MQKNLLSNALKGLQLRIKKMFANPFSKIGISLYNLKLIKNQPDNKLHTTTFLQGSISYYNSYELLHGLREIFIDEIYKITLPENPAVIDCGAHIGLSVIYFKHICPSAKIIAFEPDKKNFDLLAANIQSFNLKDITLRNEAVWINNTQISFNNEGNMASRIETSPDASQTNIMTVNAVRLKEIITGKVHFLKLDIEGAEYEVLKDIQDKLHFIDNMFVEYHGSFEQNIRLNEMLQMVSANGFSYYIREAAAVYPTPFHRNLQDSHEYDVQLNIFCFKNQ